MNAQDPNDQAARLIYQLIYLLAAYPDIRRSLNELAARTCYLDLEGDETIKAQRELRDEGFNELCILDRTLVQDFIQSSESSQVAADNLLGTFQKLLARWTAQQSHIQDLMAAAQSLVAENEQLTTESLRLQAETARLKNLLEGAE